MPLLHRLTTTKRRVSTCSLELQPCQPSLKRGQANNLRSSHSSNNGPDGRRSLNKFEAFRIQLPREEEAVYNARSLAKLPAYFWAGPECHYGPLNVPGTPDVRTFELGCHVPTSSPLYADN